MRVLISLGQKIVLTLFCLGQQTGVLRTSAEVHQQRVGLQGGVGAVVFFDGVFQGAEISVFLAAVGKQSAGRRSSLTCGEPNSPTSEAVQAGDWAVRCLRS